MNSFMEHPGLTPGEFFSSIARAPAPAYPRSVPRVAGTLPVARMDLRVSPRAAPADVTLIRLQIPQFPLRVLLRGVADAPPCALVSDEGGVARIWQAGPAALRQGVSAGIDLRTALALCPDLQVLSRAPALERRVGEELAAWWHALGYEVLPVAPLLAVNAAGGRPGEGAFGRLALSTVDAGTVPPQAQRGNGDLTVVLVSSRGAPSGVRLQRDLRALGFRVRLDDVTPGPGEGSVPPGLHRLPRAAPANDARTLEAELVLPWPARGAQALHVAVSCLFETLRVHAQARRVPLERVGWTFTQVDGACDHYVLDWPAPVRANETLVRQARERLLRHPPAGPVARLALRATFASA